MPAKLALHGGNPIRKSEFPSWPVSGREEETRLHKVLLSLQWGGYHEYVEEFETLFAGLHDCEHGVAVANGTLALELMFAAACIGPVPLPTSRPTRRRTRCGRRRPRCRPPPGRRRPTPTRRR